MSLTSEHRSDHLVLPDFGPATPWLGIDRLPERPEEFSFILISDRTGLARPGVFERGVEVANMLRPDFAIQIGDSIEGYTHNLATLDEQWAELDKITANLEVPLFRVAGNHDISNELMRNEWLRRFGALHYHFLYRDVLFLVLDTQDPPALLPSPNPALLQSPNPGTAESPDPADHGDIGDRLEHARMKRDEDPVGFAEAIAAESDSEGTIPAAMSDDQVAWAEQVIGENPHVRCTILCMHIPAWQGEGNPALTRIRRALADRPYTAFAGHLHNYRNQVIDGREHIRLGPTGGVWSRTSDEGNFDHVTWVTVTDTGLRIANIVLDGVLGSEGGVFRPTPPFSAGASSTASLVQE